MLQKTALGFAPDNAVQLVTGFALEQGHYPVAQLAEAVLPELSH